MLTPVRRLAAIMFTDLVGFSAATQRDETAALRLVEAQDRLLRPVFAAHSGRVVKSLGDGFLVEFASAMDATECALACRDQVTAYNTTHPDHPIDLRIGIHIGDVIDEGGDVLGDAVNIAARVEPLAPRGGICVTGAVHDQVVHKIAYPFVRLEAPALKNIDFAWPIYRIERTRPVRAGAPIPETTPLVERDREMDRLAQTVRSLREGHGGVVMLSGEAGIGKSRLLEEVAVKASEEGVLVAIGHAREGGLEPPLAPWVEALRRVIYELPPAELLQDVGLHAVALGRYLPDLIVRLGAVELPPWETEPDRYVVFDAVTRLLANAAERRAILLILEDLQWADEASLKLLEFAGRNGLASRVLLVGSFRSEETGEGHPLTSTIYELHRTRPVERLVLGALTESGVERLAAAALGVGQVSPAMTHALWERAGGNPLFVREMVHALLDEGRVVRTDGHASLRQGPIDFPTSVRPLLERRVRRLSAGAQELLGRASVLGPRFAAGVLESIAEESPAAFLGEVEEGVRAGVLREAVVEGNSELLFTDDRVREYLYEQVSHLRRRTLHQQAARLLEARKAPADLLAYQYERALEPTRAAPAYERAGDDALALGDYARATERFGHALTLHPNDLRAERRRIGVKLGRALQEIGRYPEAREALLEARRSVDTPEDDIPIAIWLSAVLLRTGDYGPSESEINSALATLGDAETPDAADAWSGKSVLLCSTSRGAEAIEAGRRSLAIGRRLGRPELIVQALNNLTYAYIDDYRWDDALGAVTERLSASDEGLRPYEAAITLLDAGVVFANIAAELSRAIEYFDRAEERFRWMGITSSETHTRLARADCLLTAGRWDRLETEIAEGRPLARAARLPMLETGYDQVQAELEWGRGEFGSAEARVRQLLAAMPEHFQEREHAAITSHLLLALVLAEEGRVEEARAEARPYWSGEGAHRCGQCADWGAFVTASIESAAPAGDERAFGEAVEYATSRGTSLCRALISVPVARWRRLHGSPQVSGLAEAEQFLREHEALFGLAGTLLEHAHNLDALGRDREAEGIRSEAVEIYRRLGAPLRAAVAAQV